VEGSSNKSGAGDLEHKDIENLDGEHKRKEQKGQ
jgi:hypothetical protein